MAKLILTCSILLCWACICAGQQQTATLPLRLSPSVYNSTGSSGSTCPSQDTINGERRRVREKILNYYNRSLPCSCGSPEWTKVAHLDMSDPNQQCPSNWILTTTPVRGCGRSSTAGSTCDSVFYPVNGRTYSSVCGRVNAYQFGRAAAFYFQSNNIEVQYVSGVSITHGRPGSRQHIWTFAAALGDNCTTNIRHLCPCSNVNLNWPYQVPSFIGNDYFCESGYDAAGGSCDGGYKYFPDDSLWDGQNCAPSSTCCELNSPPWFCKTLPQPTSDDLEIRLCCANSGPLENTLISLIDIYVK